MVRLKLMFAPTVHIPYREQRARQWSLANEHLSAKVHPDSANAKFEYCRKSCVPARRPEYPVPRTGYQPYIRTVPSVTGTRESGSWEFRLRLTEQLEYRSATLCCITPSSFHILQRGSLDVELSCNTLCSTICSLADVLIPQYGSCLCCPRSPLNTLRMS